MDEFYTGFYVEVLIWLEVYCKVYDSNIGTADFTTQTAGADLRGWVASLGSFLFVTQHVQLFPIPDLYP